MRELIFAPRALDDSLAARRWYESKREGLGAEFQSVLEAALERIRRLPATGKPTDLPFRRVSLRRFPYEVFYEFDSKRVLILLVFHTSQDPSKWRERLGIS